jgi:hypothetical protein
MPTNHRTTPQDEPNQTKSTPREKSTNGNKPRDARNDKSQQSENRKELGVGEDHKTKDMEEKNRGTFP